MIYGHRVHPLLARALALPFRGNPPARPGANPFPQVQTMHGSVLSDLESQFHLCPKPISITVTMNI
jgi:hypothetical protein